MKSKNIFIRVIKYSLISSSIILLLVLYRMLTSEVVGEPLEIFYRLLITCCGVVLSMYFIFVLYLYFNPDADKPRNKD